MSAKLMGMVFELELGRDEFPVMIALADHARDDGTSVYPSIAYLAWKTNLSERSVQRILRKLEERGLVEVVGNAHGGRGRTREYLLHLEKGVKKPPFKETQKGVTLTPYRKEKGDTVTPIDREKGDTTDSKRVTPLTQKGDTAVSPQPSENRQLEPVGDINAPQTARGGEASHGSWRREMFTAIYEACTGRSYQPGQKVAPRYRDKINAAIKDLPDVQPCEVPVRAAEYRHQYPGIKLTPNALANHWDELIPSARPGGKQGSLDVVREFIDQNNREPTGRDHRNGHDAYREVPDAGGIARLDSGLLEFPDRGSGGDR